MRGLMPPRAAAVALLLLLLLFLLFPGKDQDSSPPSHCEYLMPNLIPCCQVLNHSLCVGAAGGGGE